MIVISLFHEIATLNIKGLRDSLKRSAFFVWLTNSAFDIVCLQETHCTSQAELDSWVQTSPYIAHGSFFSSRSAGVAILIKRSLSCVVQAVKSHPNGRLLSIDLQLGDKSFSVTSVYAFNHNPDRDDFLLHLQHFLDPSKDNLVLGDFNTVFNQNLDRCSRSPLHPSYDSSNLLTSVFEKSRILDVWRFLHPNQRSFTYRTPDCLAASRIDVIGVPVRFIPSTSSCEIVFCPHSDHSAVCIICDIPGLPERGPFFWKLNISVLADDEFYHLISSFWLKWQRHKSNYSSLPVWWDIGKLQIKSLTTRYCSRKRRLSRSLRTSLEKQISSLQHLIDNGDHSHLTRYNSLKSDLLKLDQQEARAAAVRSRARWIEEGETSSSFFFRLEKQNCASKIIDALMDDNGDLVTNTNQLLTVWHSFYSNLFTALPVDENLQDDFLDSLERVLPPEERDLCEGPLALDECFAALQGMENNKTPGLDGLPKEFYVRFWSVLGHELVDVLNFCYQSGVLSVSQRRGVISLVHKKGPRYLCKNWRPISLLCTDFKIASRSIARRLRSVIASVISPDQTCSVPDRFIGENVRLLSDSIDYANSTNTPLALLSFDQEKAFDRVDWSYLLATLRKMGFGPSFRRWILLFYTGPQSSVLVNGFFTKWFSPTRGVRQGCPLSASLYVIVAETLACKLRSSQLLHGISVPHSIFPPALISQYADDTTLLCTSDVEIKESFNVYDKYESASGAKLNLDKCKGLWCGSWKGRTDPPVCLQWSSESLVCLGITIGHGDLSHANWDKRLDNFSKVIQSWRQRSLSYSGKALVLNALALSGLWYTASILPIPNWVLAFLKAKITSFFWSRRYARIYENTLMQPQSRGGFNLVSPKLKGKALHIIWVRRYVCHPSKWCAFFSYFVCNSFLDGPDSVLASPAFYPLDRLPSFYRSVLESWATIGGHCPAGQRDYVIPRPPSDQPLPVLALTTKLAYTILVDQASLPPPCITSFQPLYGSLYWPATWKQISSFPLDRKVRDHAWRVAHNSLYTMDRLSSSGRLPNNLCHCTTATETPVHLFFHCSLAQTLLLWAQTLFLRVTPRSPSLEPRHLLFGYNPAELEFVPPVFFYLLSLIKYFIWLARNDFRFNYNPPNVDSIRSSVISRLNRHLLSFSKRSKTPVKRRLFHRTWNVLGKFAPDIRTIIF